MRNKIIQLSGVCAVACSALFSACARLPQQPALTLMRVDVETNHIPMTITGDPQHPTYLIAIEHPAHDEVVTNYVFGVNGTEYLIIKKR